MGGPFFPIGLQGGLNTYGYVNANPLSYIDPLGLFFRNSVEATCAQDPAFGAETFGQMVENTAAAVKCPEQQQQIQDTANAIRSGGLAVAVAAVLKGNVGGALNSVQKTVNFQRSS